MSQINHIRDLNANGYTVSDIQRATGADRKTIRKYLEVQDFSPEIPVSRERPSKLDPYKGTIKQWMEEDKRNWYKQRHTAKRIYDRLKDELGFDGGYSIVQRYVKSLRGSQKSQRANQELVWEPGTAQADFGEADFMENGMAVRKKYLVLSFPYSNDSFCQVFGGENAECVCQGLLDIFYYIGGVPQTIVFDNATGIGRRICDEIHESKLFSKFRAHHRFSARFCNPGAGWEKGNVESKVGYDRRNLFVPVQPFDDIEEYNRRLLDAHEEKASENHYKKGVRISELFKEDRAALHDLPGKKFRVCRYEHMKADGYGKIRMDGDHYYSTRPEYAGRRDVLVGITAHYVNIYDENGHMMLRHKREYGSGRTDTTDYSTTVAMLTRRPGSWKNSGVRLEMADPLREYMDSIEKPVLKDCLTLLRDLTETHGFYPAIDAMGRALRDGRISSSDAHVIAERICSYGMDTPPFEGPDLGMYDEAFLPSGSEGGDMA